MDTRFRELHVEREVTQLEGYPGAVLITECEVRRFDDVRNLAYERAYLIKVRTRVSAPGISSDNVSASGYLDYPIRADVSVDPIAGSDGATVELIEYFPRTVNSAVSSVHNSGFGTNLVSTRQHSSGSSLSQTNSYSVGANVGFAGDLFSGGVSVEASHSETATHDESDTAGLDRGRNIEQGSSSSMSVLDWSSYSQANLDAATVGWVWSQEFPLNALDYQNTALNDSVTLASSDVGNVLNGSMLMPPSRMALFGIDFISTSHWIYRPGTDAGDSQGPIFSTSVTLTTGSHMLTGEGSPPPVGFVLKPGQLVSVSPPDPLDCVALALDPIVCEGPGNGAIVGFVNATVTPTGSGAASLVSTSAANTLTVMATGFEAPSSADCVLTATLPANGSASLCIRFKVLDALNDYTLFLKGWIASDTPAMLSIVVNGQNSQIVRHIDSQQNGSGSDNITSVILRQTEFASNDYVDYLRMGMNVIAVTITPSSAPPTGSTCDFVLRSIAVA